MNPLSKGEPPPPTDSRRPKLKSAAEKKITDKQKLYGFIKKLNGKNPKLAAKLGKLIKKLEKYKGSPHLTKYFLKNVLKIDVSKLIRYGKYIQKLTGSLDKEIDGKIGKNTLKYMKRLAYREARQSTVAEPDFE